MTVTREAYIAFLEQVEAALEEALRRADPPVVNGQRAELMRMHREVAATRRALLARRGGADQQPVAASSR